MTLASEQEKRQIEEFQRIKKLKVDLEDLVKLLISTKAFNRDGIATERYDKSVILSAKGHDDRKISSLLFGKNKRGIELSDGVFASQEEIALALSDAVNNLEQGTIAVNKTGKQLNIDELLYTINQACGAIIIGERNEKFINQNSRNWGVEGKNSDERINKGVALIKKGIPLPQGIYISIDELYAALDEYMVVRTVEPEKVETKEKNSPKMIRVVKKYKNQISAWLCLAALTITLASGFRVKDNVVTTTSLIAQSIDLNNLEYFTFDSEADFQAALQKLINAKMQDINMGSTQRINDGDTFNTNSVLNGQNKTVGQEFARENKQAGDYRISGFSIVKDNNIINYIENFDGKQIDANLLEFVETTCKKNNLNLEDVEIRLHFGTNNDYTRLGWVDIRNLIKKSDINENLIKQEAEKGSSYKGIESDFNGNTITIDTLNGPVTLKVVDENGNLLEPGTPVIGSDGNQYIVGALEEKQETITSQVEKEVEKVDGKRITWSIQDSNLALAIVPVLTSLAFAIQNKKKNEKLQENPKVFEFASEAEYSKFLQEFESAKTKYEQTSSFGKRLKQIFYEKEVDLLQNLTEEQIQQIYSAIKSCNNADYRYSANDQISFKKGHIIATHSDGTYQDITDIITPMIKDIGRGNAVAVEGLLKEEEIKNGIRR